MHRDWKELSSQVTVAPQIRPEDVPQIAAAGFKTVMCNRPDGEEAGQPDWDDIVEACARNGLEARYVPQADRSPTDYAINGFDKAMRETDGKLFAFCRTGTRCGLIWDRVMERRAQGAA